MKYYIVAETRENNRNIHINNSNYNDYVSTKSMKDFEQACIKNNYDCTYIGGMGQLIDILSRDDTDFDKTIFINYNYGYPSQFKRGQSPILFELKGAKYSGSDPLTSLLVNDKHFSKKLLTNIINSPKDVIINSSFDSDLDEVDMLHFPVVVKPNSEGSSLGIDNNSFCENKEETIKRVNELLNMYKPVIIEEYIPGFEVTVWIIGNKNNYKLIQPLIISTNSNYYFENEIFTINDKANHTRNYSLPNSVLPSYITEMIIDTSKKSLKN